MDYKSKEIKILDEKIEDIENIITKMMKDYEDKNKRFAGIAFVSFDTEDMKNLVLE